jgi:preprotein translocase subunit YajC
VNPLPVIWLALMLGAFYVLLVRPQRRQMAAHQQLMASLAEGDEVMTMGGIFGRISHLGDDVIDLEVSPGTSLRVARSAISRKVEV